MKDKIIELLKSGKSYNFIVAEVGCSKSTIHYHAKILGILSNNSKNNKYNWKEISDYYNQGNSLKKCKEKYGFTSGSWSRAVIRKEVRPRSFLVTPDSLFREDKAVSGTALKQNLLKFDFFEDKCYNCGVGNFWEGKPLTIQVHHVNGNKRDNRLENLTLLCPNCHSQTENWGYKDRNKIFPYGGIGNTSDSGSED
jgi:hypothetical protein